jgi:translation initiation factor SUI1
MDNLELFSEKTQFVVDISIKQRNSKKFITHIANIPDRYDLHKILRYIKKLYKCGGSVLKKDDEEVIQLSGDQRKNAEDFFIRYNVMDKENIKIHGF